jgi:N-acetylglucosamine-6-phosphate deacetylase
MTSIVGARLMGTGEAATINIRNGRIASIGGKPDSDTIELEGTIAAPGLIDLQINGAFGEDFTNDPGSIWRVGARLLRHGVTAFLPTIITSPPEQVQQALTAMASGPPPGYRGARALGLHFEGPMLSVARRGTHNESLLRKPSLDLVKGWSRSDGVLMVTLAPELNGAREVVAHLLAAGVIVAAGHTVANYEQSREAFGWGVSHVTHLFNAMEPFGHRDPGPIGAMIVDGRVTAGLIVDGLHSHPAAVAGAWKLLGPSRLALVTDAMAAAGVGDGNYHIADVPVVVEQGRVINKDGRLAGSTLNMDEALRNLMDFTGCGLADAVAAASTVPATITGQADLGRLEPGASADLVFFYEDRQVAATMVGGELMWRRDTP